MFDQNERTFMLRAMIGSAIVINGERKGRLIDIVTSISSTAGSIKSLTIKYNSSIGVKNVPWVNVKNLKSNLIILSDENIRHAEKWQRPDQSDFELGARVLGQKLLDLENRAVCVARDVRLVLKSGELHVSEIDFAPFPHTRGNVFRYLSEWFCRLLGGTLRNRIVSFSNVVIPSLGMSGWNAIKQKIQPIDLAELLAEAGIVERILAFNNLEDRLAAAVLRCAQPRFRSELIHTIGVARAAQLVATMKPVDALQVLSVLPLIKIEEILDRIQGMDARKIRYLLANKTNETAHFLACRGIRFLPTATVQQVMSDYCRLAPAAEGLPYIYVVDEGERLLGVVSVDCLLRANTEDTLADIMTFRPVQLRQADPIEKASRLFLRYDFLALPVVDHLGRLAGVVSRKEIDFIARNYLSGAMLNVPDHIF